MTVENEAAGQEIDTDNTELEVAPVESQEDPDTSTDEAGQEPEKKPSGFKRRVEKFQQKIQDKELEVEYWKMKAMQQELAPTQAEPTTQAKPKISDYNSVEDWSEAYGNYLEDKLVATTHSKVQERAAKQSEKSQMEQIVNTYQSRVKAQSAELPDYDDVVAELPQLPQDTVEFLLTSDVGPKLTYQLALDPDEVERLLKLPAVRRAAELGKLEDKLTSKTVAPKKVTAVSPKLTTLKGDTKVKVASSSAEATSFQEYAALRKKEMQSRK